MNPRIGALAVSVASLWWATSLSGQAAPQWVSYNAATKTVTFTLEAGAPGSSGPFNRIFCGVPGHGLSGMWIRFKVDPAAKAASLVSG